MGEPEPVTFSSAAVAPSHAQIFSLDVTALSDTLDLSEDELLAALQHGSYTQASEERRRSIKRASVVPNVAHPATTAFGASTRLGRQRLRTSDPPPYVVCLVVSQRSALRAIRGNAFSVLELSLRRLFVHRHCSRIVVSVTDERLSTEVEAIVRACKRCASPLVPLQDVATAIDVLYGDQDDVSAVRHACMYVDATAVPASPSSRSAPTTTTLDPSDSDASASSVASSIATPFVIVRVDTRVFEVATIDELVHQQQNASVLTDGLTSAVILVDANVPVGLWVCSMAALLDHCEVSELSALKLTAPQDDDPHEASIAAWLPWVLGTLHCETVHASAELNWEEVQPNGRALVYRFEPMVQPIQYDDDGSDSNREGGGALSAIQAELDSDGIRAALRPIRTSVVYRPRDAPASAIDMALETSPQDAIAIDEQSPLLSSCSRTTTTTVLSDIDLEGAASKEAVGTATTVIHAYVIHVDAPLPTDTTATAGTPELIFALPDDPSRRDTTDVLPPVLRVHRRRSSDRLPSSVTSVTLEAVVLDAPRTKASFKHAAVPTRRVSVVLHVEKRVPLVGYLILTTALCAVSSQGAVLDLLVGVPPLLKLFWRVSGVSLALLPFATLSMYRKGLPKLPGEKKWLALACVLAYACSNATFLTALSLTTIGHVYIFANSHSLLLVAAKLLTREPLSARELLGAALGFSGGVLTTLDRSGATAATATTKGEGSPATVVKSPTPLGDLIAFTGAFGGVAYLLTAKKLRAALGVRVFLFLLTTGVALLLLPVLVLNHERLGLRLDEPTHATHGLVGWVHHLDIELYLVLVGSVCGTMGFIAALKYFDPLVVSVTMLTEPVVATIISIFVGVERVPGWPTLAGGLAVICGCLLVLLATHTTSQTVDVSRQLVKTPFTSATSVLRMPDDELTRSQSRASRSSSSSALSSEASFRRRGTYGTLAQ